MADTPDAARPLLAALAVSPDNLPLWQMVLALPAIPGAGVLEIVRTARQHLPDDPELRCRLAAILRDQGALDLAAELHPEGRAADQRAKAAFLLEMGQATQALALYRAAVARDPQLADPELAQRLQQQLGGGALGVHALTTSGEVENKVINPWARRDGTAPRAEGTRAQPFDVIHNQARDADHRRDVIERSRRAREEVTFRHVAGMDEVKHRIRRLIVTPFVNPELYQRFNRRIGGGLLLYGPPGVGKTLLARATAGECNAHFQAVELSEVLSKYVGEAEREIHALFRRARDKAPSVLFFDEIETLGGRRDAMRSGNQGQTVSQFLMELDGFEKGSNEGVLVIAATNMPWALDPAFKRPGRFDTLIFVPPPDQAARRALFGLRLADLPGGRAVDADRLAARTEGFSGADIDKVIQTASDLAIDRTLDTGREQVVDDALLAQALAQVKPSTREWLETARNYVKYSNQDGAWNDVETYLKAARLG